MGMISHTKEEVIKVLLRLDPQSIVAPLYADWCCAISPTNKLCFRPKGHDGPHATAQGLRLDGYPTPGNVIFNPIYTIVVWE